MSYQKSPTKKFNSNFSSRMNTYNFSEDSCDQGNSNTKEDKQEIIPKSRTGSVTTSFEF